MSAAIPRYVAKKARELLLQTDEAALRNVDSGKGGPFAAAMLISNVDERDDLNFVIGPETNQVLIGEGHAEMRLFDGRHVSSGIDILQHRFAEQGVEPIVVVVTSAQSCLSCVAAIKIFQHHIISKYVFPHNFHVLFGAPYSKTQEVALFYDLPYLCDAVRFVHNPDSPVSMIKTQECDITRIPANVAEEFRAAPKDKQIAVVARGEEVLGIGEDRRFISPGHAARPATEAEPAVEKKRGWYELIRSAEVEAMRMAVAQQRADRVDQPWILGDPNYLNTESEDEAILYTTTRDFDPLTYGEMQWKSVRRRVVVTANSNEEKYKKETQMLRHMGNADFFEAIVGLLGSEPGTAYSSFLNVHMDRKFPNFAQSEWRRMIDEKQKERNIIYNGIGVDTVASLDPFELDPALKQYKDLANNAFSGSYLPPTDAPVRPLYAGFNALAGLPPHAASVPVGVEVDEDLKFQPRGRRLSTNLARLQK